MDFELVNIIALYVAGAFCIGGCFVGATHHAMTGAAALILATLLLQERIAERRKS